MKANYKRRRVNKGLDNNEDRTHLGFSYDKTPYIKDILNALESKQELKTVTVIKGSSIGMSTAPINVWN